LLTNCVSSGGALSTTLPFPDGQCNTSGTDNITVTNGAAPGHITIEGNDILPADFGTAGSKTWTLCQPNVGGSCTGPSNQPGPDQASEQDLSSTGNVTNWGPWLVSGEYQNDTGFSADASAAANQAVVETLKVNGPASSTDNSATFTAHWQWSAEP